MTNQKLLFLATVGALCVISFVHVFLIQLYGVTFKPRFSRAVGDFQQSSCRTNLKHRHTCCPPGGIVTFTPGGRLGNQIWEYASVWAVARRTGLPPYIARSNKQRLEKVFETLSIPTLEEIAYCPINLNTSVKSLEQWKYTNQSIVLTTYGAVQKEVLTRIQDILQEFTFRKKLRDESYNVFKSASRLTPNKTCTFVGVHVRRTDYKGYLQLKYKIALADPAYFLSAMDYFDRKYQNVVFVVLSDDPVWCLKHFTKKNIYMASKRTSSSPGQDLAIMAACNHSIIDYGSFGEWGAIFAGGETIFYNLSQNQKIADQLPNWHVLS